MTRAGLAQALAAIAVTVGSVVAWQRQPASSQSDGASLDGATLFQAKGCAACHAGPDSPAAVGALFPTLVGASSWSGDRRPDLTATQYLTEAIREPWAFIAPGFSPGSAGPTGAMPALELSDAEVAAIAEYLLAG